MTELWILCVALDPLKLYPHMKFHFNSISWTWVIAFWQKKCDFQQNWQREITPKILMPELLILCVALNPLKFYPQMEFHFNNISCTWVIAFGQKKCDGTGRKKCDVTYGQTDRRTDGQTDDGKGIQCHLCLQQVTQNGPLSVSGQFLQWVSLIGQEVKIIYRRKFVGTRTWNAQ